MNAPKAPATEPRAKWCADSKAPCNKVFVRTKAFWPASIASLAVSEPRLYAFCHDASKTFAKSIRPNRPDGSSMPAKWNRMSASMGVNREKRVMRAASFKKSVRVILPSLLLLVAFRMMSSTRSISLIMFWNARTLAYEILLPAEMLQSVCRFSSR